MKLESNFIQISKQTIYLSFFDAGHLRENMKHWLFQHGWKENLYVQGERIDGRCSSYRTMMLIAVETKFEWRNTFEAFRRDLSAQLKTTRTSGNGTRKWKRGSNNDSTLQYDKWFPFLYFCFSVLLNNEGTYIRENDNNTDSIVLYLDMLANWVMLDKSLDNRFWI